MARLQLPNPPPSSPAVRRTMQANRARDTGPERRLRAALRAAGYPGYRLNWKKAPGRPDIAYPGRKVAIFVHGCFWHHCPDCHPHLPKSNPEFWARKFELNAERDARKRHLLESLGWSVEEVFECRIDAPDTIEDVTAILTRPPAAVSRAGSIHRRRRARPRSAGGPGSDRASNQGVHHGVSRVQPPPRDRDPL